MMAGLAIAADTDYDVYFPQGGFMACAMAVPGQKFAGTFIPTKDETVYGINEGLYRPTKEDIKKWSAEYNLRPDTSYGLGALAPTVQPVAEALLKPFDFGGYLPALEGHPWDWATILGDDLDTMVNGGIEIANMLALAGGPIYGVSPFKVSEKIQKDPSSYVMIDTRPAYEYDAFHIPGVLHIPTKALKGYLQEFPIKSSRKIVTICNAGTGSAGAALIVRSTGHLKVLSLAGGTVGWPTPADQFGGQYLVVKDSMLADSMK